MQADNSNIAYDASFFQCYICLNNVKKPRMCPSCSKLACESCLRKWIEDSRSECPHCRKVLPLNSFADCERFVNDIKHLISSMDSNEKTKQKCKQHKIEMQYYCEDCKEAICSDCGMFGMKHRNHPITHLSKIYQQNKNKILNQLAKFDQKIQQYRKKGFYIKIQTQKLMIQIGQKKSFIEEYFLTLMERLEEEFRDKKAKLENQHEENTHEVELLEAFREQYCHELETKTQRQIITSSEDLVAEIQKLCEKQREKQFEEEEYSFETIQQIVPKYQTFTYEMKKYLLTHEGITYSEPYIVNGIQWRLKIYPRGNGVAKDTHISVFLQMSKAYSNENKYEYKIELINHYSTKDSIVREYSSKFDIGECWGYNQFVPLTELENGFLNVEGALNFVISVRNPTYKSLVRDQENYIKVLENRLKSNEEHPNVVRSRENLSKLSKQSQSNRQQLKKALLSSQHGEQSSSNTRSNILPNEEYYGNNPSQSKNNSNSLSMISNGMQALSLTNNNNNKTISGLSLEAIDNMAMLETDSVEEDFRIDERSNRIESP